MSTPLAEALLDLLLLRYREADGSVPAAPGTLAAVVVGPHVGRASGLPTPRLTVTFGNAARKRTSADDRVETKLILELALDDAATGDEPALRLALRWAAWIEAVLVPAGELGGPYLGGLAEDVEPLNSAFAAGGPGMGEFTLRLRFVLTTTALLGNPYVTS